MQLVLCEPFALAYDVVMEAMMQDLRQRQHIIKALSVEFGACFVPFQSAMDDALALAPPDYWTLDGVHPSPAGHSLLARCWLEKVT